MNTHWMTDAACPDRLDLPWLADADQTAEWDRLTMAGICAGCPARAACEVYVSVQDVTGGFWAGRHRDLDAATMDAAGWPVWAVQPALPGLGDAA